MQMMWHQAFKSIFAVAENYPDLKANQNFMMLQEELVGIENKIACSRQPYDRTVLALNIAVHQFPTNNLARIIFSALAVLPPIFIQLLKCDFRASRVP
ncbi:MAG: hypothetical protein Kow0019_08670 [Methanobacteriaceae archaeon]